MASMNRWIAPFIDFAIVAVLGALLWHHDIDKSVFWSIVLPLIGARAAAVRHSIDRGSGALALFLAAGAIINSRHS